MSNVRCVWRGGAAALIAMAVLAGRPASAQMTDVDVTKNAGNSADEVQALLDAYQRRSTVEIVSQSGTTFTTRYAEIVGADTDLLLDRSVSQTTDYSIEFTVTAPGAYYLTVDTALRGAFTLVDDGHQATADLSAVTGSQTGGTLASGALGLADPGTLSGGGGGNVAFSPSGTARIDGVSNGTPVTHRLTFTWSASCGTEALLGLVFGDECAVRLGLPTDYLIDVAGDYPGVGSRNAADDGHFVTVTMTSLCGDGTLDAGEDCDDGNATDGDCCSSACEIEPDGTVCRPAAGACDAPEECDGLSDDCPADAKSPTSTVCRPSAGTCDVAESCDGTGDDCPADAKQSTVCRAAAGVCDLAESCDGVGNDCPTDVKSTTVCRPAAGPCDLAESCAGASDTCPADAKRTTVCRAAAGACDVAETCDGVGDTCPADAKSADVCRTAAGACDVAESCDGASDDCPGDAKSSAVCRSAAGACDVAESCDGTGDDCPADAKSTAVCRSAAGVCDVVESCDGTGDDCPPDAKSTAVCRGVAGECDVAESCDGIANDCPADATTLDEDGDGMCDAIDACPLDADPDQADGDGDGIGDACDPCTNVVPVFFTRTRLRLSRLATQPGDDRMRLRGKLSLPAPMAPALDPRMNGVRVLLRGGAYALDATIPGGAYDVATGVGWQGKANGRGWDYRNAGVAAPRIGGIERVRISIKPSARRTLVRFMVRGRDWSYALRESDLPATATLVLDSPVARTGQCGEGTFTTATCTIDVVAGRLSCRS